MKNNVQIFAIIAMIFILGCAQAQTTSAVRLMTGGEISNTIIYNNPKLNPVPNSVLIEHSISDSILIGIGNISLLTTSPFSGTDYRINKNSPAYNAGRNSDLRNKDTLGLAYYPRVACDTLDIGAYEHQIEKTEVFSNPQAQHICEDDRPVLSVDAYGTNVTYQWQRNGVDIAGAVGKTYTITGALSDSGTYRVIVNGDCCSDTSAEAEVKIDAKPMVLAMNDTTILSGENVTLRILASVGTTYWMKEDRVTPVFDTNLMDITETVTYIAFARNGVCTDVAEDSETITISGVPCEIKTKSDTALCPSEPYRLLVDMMGSTTVFKKWVIAGTAIEYANATIVRPEMETRYVAIGEATDGSGETCSDTLTINIHQIDLQVTASIITVCEDSLITLSSTPSIGVKWYTLSGDSVGSGNTTLMPPQNTVTQYVAVWENGVCSDRDTVKVYSNPPAIRAFSEDTTVCEGEPIHLTTNVEVQFVLWKNKTTGVNLQEDPTIYPTESGIYEAWVYDSLCGDVSVEVAITVRSKPAFAVDMPDTAFCKDDVFSLTAVPEASYWTLLDGTHIHQTSITANTSETYIAVYEDADGICTVADTVTVDVETLLITACEDTTITRGDSMVLWSTPIATLWVELDSGDTLTSLTITPQDTTAYVAILQSSRCEVKDTVFVYIQQADTFLVEIFSDIECYEDSGWAFVKVYGNTGPYTYLWSNDSTESEIAGLPAGTTYSVTVTDASGKTEIRTTTVPLGEPVVAYNTVSSDNENCDNGRISVTVSGGTPKPDGTYYYSWNDGYTSDNNGSRFNIESGIYLLTVTDDRGCESETEITLICTYKRVMPTLYISPNGDGDNDFLSIKHIERYPLNRVTIINSYGEEIIRYQNYNNMDIIWNGRNTSDKILPDGVYFYVVEAEDIEPMAGWLLMGASKKY